MMRIQISFKSNALSMLFLINGIRFLDFYFVNVNIIRIDSSFFRIATRILLEEEINTLKMG